MKGRRSLKSISSGVFLDRVNHPFDDAKKRGGSFLKKSTTISLKGIEEEKREEWSSSKKPTSMKNQPSQYGVGFKAGENRGGGNQITLPERKKSASHREQAGSKGGVGGGGGGVGGGGGGWGLWFVLRRWLGGVCLVVVVCLVGGVAGWCCVGWGSGGGWSCCWSRWWGGGFWFGLLGGWWGGGGVGVGVFLGCVLFVGGVCLWGGRDVWGVACPGRSQGSSRKKETDSQRT